LAIKMERHRVDGVSSAITANGRAISVKGSLYLERRSPSPLEAFPPTRALVNGQGSNPKHRELRLDKCSSFVLISIMTDRPATTPKQMEKLAAAAERDAAACPLDPDAEMPAEYWESVLNDPRVAAMTGIPIQQRRLSEIPRHVLRVACQRCDRIVEIQKADAVRFYGQHAIWKDVGQKLLDDTCQQRTGRHEEDGCWPGFNVP
jgi:hypothetical protein